MKKALIGYGGHAREVMAQMKTTLHCFVDDRYLQGSALPLSKFNPDEYEVMVAIANPKDRREIIEKLPKNTTYFTWVHPTALIMQDVEIGEGSFVGAYSILTTNIKIGKHAILNRGNQIGHDTVIGNYFSAMPGSIVSGNVHVGNDVYMGTNSTIIERVFITENIIIGANGVVVNDIISSGTYVGVPVKKIK
jgi:sugar O-acyltransferase (sialic acid O-acetyltransferase NeuD family)